MVESATLAWTATIAAPPSSLALVDLVVGPTNDVIVADKAGGSVIEQRRWDKAGAFVSLHQDHAGPYVGPISTSNLVVDAQNDLFYGLLLTGLPMGANSGAFLGFSRLAPGGTAVFTDSSTSAMATTGGPPQVLLFDAGADAAGNLHGALALGNPPYFQAGVYCYGSGGANLGVSAHGIASLLTAADTLWPSPDGGLYLAKPLTGSIDLGCGGLTVPAAGGLALAKLTGAGACQWSKLLALPKAALKGTQFRLGADGSLMLAVVHAGAIDFGGGPIQSTGTSSLSVARFDTGGNLLWTKSFGGAGSSFKLGSLGVNGVGTTILSARYAGAVDLGGGPLPASGDTFLAAFDLAGHLKWSKAVTVGAQGGLLTAVGGCGVVLATSSPTVDLGAGPLSTQLPAMPASIGIAALGL